MTITRKPDAQEIKRFLEHLKSQPWLGPARRWWPDFLFRVDNIEATANILNTGKLLSRAAAQTSGLMITDSASPDVIARTSDHWKQYARLYFRPRTPTQFSNEGFRPAGHYTHNAHCRAERIGNLDLHQVVAGSGADGQIPAGVHDCSRQARQAGHGAVHRHTLADAAQIQPDARGEPDGVGAGDEPDLPPAPRGERPFGGQRPKVEAPAVAGGLQRAETSVFIARKVSRKLSLGGAAPGSPALYDPSALGLSGRGKAEIALPPLFQFPAIRILLRKAVHRHIAPDVGLQDARRHPVRGQGRTLSRHARGQASGDACDRPHAHQSDGELGQCHV